MVGISTTGVQSTERTKPMTTDFELLHDQILEILPNATFGEDNDGQLVIYTNLRESANNSLTDMDTGDRV